MKRGVLSFESMHGRRIPQVRRFANFVLSGGVTPPRKRKASGMDSPSQDSPTSPTDADLTVHTPPHMTRQVVNQDGTSPIDTPDTMPAGLSPTSQARWLRSHGLRSFFDTHQTQGPHTSPNSAWNTPTTQPNTPNGDGAEADASVDNHDEEEGAEADKNGGVLQRWGSLFDHSAGGRNTPTQAPMTPQAQVQRPSTPQDNDDQPPDKRAR